MGCAERVQILHLDSNTFFEIFRSSLSGIVCIGMRDILPGRLQLRSENSIPYMLEVASLKYAKLNEISDNDLQDTQFNTVEELINRWCQDYVYLTDETELTIIRWVSPNE